MAFIVEMLAGRAPSIIVEGIDEYGQRCVDRVITVEDPPDPEWRTFSCAAWLWEEIQKLAKEHGWHPLGTVPRDVSDGRWDTAGEFKHSYEPGDWGYVKLVLAEDAAAWADALERFADRVEAGEVTVLAKSHCLLIREGMTEEELEAANRDMSLEFLRELIAFLRRGGFRFAWDD